VNPALTRLDYPYSQEDAATAHERRGFNCGPAALAFALRITPDRAMDAIPGFDARKYTSPTMMKVALQLLGVHCRDVTRKFTGSADREANAENVNRMFSPDGVALVRLQWTGPWTEPGMNPKWAYSHTHWICAWEEPAVKGGKAVFDINGGTMTYAEWTKEIAPAITASIQRADGGYFPTHIWRIERERRHCLTSTT
jgi:hypothetical protein